VRRLLALQSWCEARNARRSPCVITTSRYAASRIAGYYGVAPGRIRQVPELIDLESAGETIAERGAAPAAGREPVLLAVAHLYPRKSIADLLRALALLPPRWRHVPLHVVGLGPEWERLQALTDRLGLRPRVTFLGHVSRARLAAEYRGCALFCLPSRQEGFGIVYLEAMAAGRAIVACRAAAVPEIVEDGVTGLLTRPGDPTSLAGALTELLDDPARRARLGEAGRERVRAYAAPVVARRFLEVAEEARAYGSS
jgi:glycosyltransferase involved in cell wall biosynthesis